MKTIHLRRLSVRIFIIIFAVLLVPFAAMLWYVKTDMEELLRDEISLKVLQNLSKGEYEIGQLFGRMANISNVFFRDPEITQAFSDDSVAYYKRNAVFNQVISDISMQNLYDYIMDDVRITFFDRKNQTYASWSLNYGDYTYLLNQDWVKRSLDARGFVVWSMAAKGYDGRKGEAPTNQIALARSIMDDYGTEKRLGTILISIDQRKICDLLETYKYSGKDLVFASTYDGEVLFSNNQDLPTEELRGLARDYRSQDKGNSVVAVKGNKFLLSLYTVSRTSLLSREKLKIFYLTDYESVSLQIRSLVFKINILCVFFILAVLLIAVAIADKIASPMRVLSRRMADFRVGDEPVRIEGGRTDEIGEIYAAFHDLSVNVNDLFERLRQEKVTREKYHYESLRSKMSPHFLFNTLTSIRWMAIIRKADNIRESIDALAAILKYSMTSDDETVELARELDIVRSYCHIQNVRFGNSYSLEVDVAPGLERCRIIKFILQPTVENCFKHAFGSSSGSGVIAIRGAAKDGSLILSVSDDGRGFSDDDIKDFAARRPAPEGEDRGTCIGLRVIDERIRIAFGDGYGLSLSNDGGARVEYRLPLILSEEKEKR